MRKIAPAKMTKELKTKECLNRLQLLTRKEQGKERDHVKDGETELKGIEIWKYKRQAIVRDRRDWWETVLTAKARKKCSTSKEEEREEGKQEEDELQQEEKEQEQQEEEQEEQEQEKQEQ
jgi:hypothetical protein